MAWRLECSAADRCASGARVSGPSQIVERIRAASQSGRSLRIRGAATWLGAGRPSSGEEALSLADHAGIVEYVPGDLTLTARAGTTHATILAATAQHGQWLPLAPWGGDAGTIGATVSTATAGPFAFAMGAPRDVVLGMEFVTGNGDVVRSGGRVVKNVAGFDLTRLLTGSWGTLGVITELSLRLRAIPDRVRHLAIAVDSSERSLGELATRLRALPFKPVASELVNGALAARVGLQERDTLLVQLGGNARAVDAQTDAMRAFGPTDDMTESVWTALRGVDGPAAWRWSGRPSDFGGVWGRALRAVIGLRSSFAHANPARGIVRVVADADAAALAKAATSFDGTVSIESLPRDAWVLIPTPAPSPIAVAIRRRFDPHGILNPGIMAGLA